MRSRRTYAGVVKQGDTPSWTALEAILGPELLGHFMWMFELELEDGARVDAYKHRWTRRYFHLADDGRAFIYTRDGRYREIDRDTSIEAVFVGWKSMDVTETEEAALRDALRRARAASS